MRKIWILKSILDLLFILLIFSSIGLILLSAFFLFINEGAEFPTVLNISGLDIETIDSGVKLLLIAGTLAYGLFVYSVYLLKKMVRLFTLTRLFDKYIISGFQRVGICFVLISCLIHIPGFFYKISHGSIKFSLFGSMFNSFLFLISLGLFFMVLSSIFKIAKHAKEENQLTG